MLLPPTSSSIINQNDDTYVTTADKMTPIVIFAFQQLVSPVKRSCGSGNKCLSEHRPCCPKDGLRVLFFLISTAFCVLPKTNSNGSGFKFSGGGEERRI